MEFKKTPRTGIHDVKVIDGLLDLEYTPMTEEEMENYNPYEWEDRLEIKIVDTLAETGADEKSKEQLARFAKAVISSMEYMKEEGVSEGTLPKKRDELIKNAKITKKKLEQFRGLIIKYRSDCGDMTANAVMTTEITQKCDIDDVIIYFDRIMHNLGILKTRKRKQGQRNVAGKMAGLRLYNLWVKYFQNPPTSCKDSASAHTGDKYQTRYDKLCSLLYEAYGVKISQDPRILKNERKFLRGKK